MPPKNAQTPVKKGRGRPPKSTSASSPSHKPATIVTDTPSKRGQGRPPKSTTDPKNTTTSAAASPAKKRGRPSLVLSTSSPKKPGRPSLATTSSPKTSSRQSYPKPPANILSTGVKKRGRPVGSTNTSAKKPATTTTTTTTKAKGRAKAPVKAKAPRAKRGSNLSSNLRSLISSASKVRLAEILSVLCERYAIVAKATSSALREEKVQRAERTVSTAEVECVVEGADAVEEEEAEEVSMEHGSGKVNGVENTKGKPQDMSNPTEKTVHHHHVTVDEDQQVHTEQGTEPKSGYDADVEPEIPATATEGEMVSQEAETETIAQAVFDAG